MFVSCLVIQLESIEHDYVRSLKSQSYANVNLVQKGLGSIPPGGNIFHWIFFCFHVVKPPIPILAILPFLRISKNSIVATSFSETKGSGVNVTFMIETDESVISDFFFKNYVGVTFSL